MPILSASAIHGVLYDVQYKICRLHLRCRAVFMRQASECISSSSSSSSSIFINTQFVYRCLLLGCTWVFNESLNKVSINNKESLCNKT